MAHCTMEAYEYVGHVDRAGKIADSPSIKKQKVATTLLRDEIPNGTLPNQLLRVSPKPSDRLVDTSMRRFCLRCVMRHGLLARGLPLVFYMFSAVVCVGRSDSTSRVRSKMKSWMSG